MADKICKVDGCDEKYIARGYCRYHYNNMMRHGDPLHVSDIDGRSKKPEYRLWKGMRERCYYKKHNMYHRYGGRGITVCDRWRNSFNNFIQDMGPRPTSKHQIDRINNDGNYEPKNCRWTTRSKNVQNSTSAKLNEKQVKEIRSLYGEYSSIELAVKYKVSKTQILYIINNKSWKSEV